MRMNLATLRGPDLPADRPNFAEDGYQVIDCRGIKLLAMPYNNIPYICVHEISMALWKMFDTPRVSVQKKISDLGIHLLQTTKSQVVILRREGIIGNFRATMITVRDAEKLYDALEYSRRKRGLVKHILKEPEKRATRPEEHGAKKLSMTPRYKKRERADHLYVHNNNAASHYFNDHSPSSPVNMKQVVGGAEDGQQEVFAQHSTLFGPHVSTLHTPPHQIPGDVPSPSTTSNTYTPVPTATVVGCALIGTPTHDLNGWEEAYFGGGGQLKIDVLFRAEEPVLAGGADCQDHFIELLPNTVTVNRAGESSYTNSPSGREDELDSGGVRVSSRMDNDLHYTLGEQHQQQKRTLMKEHLSHSSSSSSLSNHHHHQRQQHQSTGRRRSKHHDPDYQPSAYAVKSSQSLSSSLVQSAKRLSSRTREKEVVHLAVPSTSNGSRFSSSRMREISSPTFELNELEERLSVYSGVSGNSSRLKSSTPERFLFLDESSEGEGEEGERGGGSDGDSVFMIDCSPSPEMRITVPGKGSSSLDRRVVRTKLRHFAQTTSPQITALSRGKRLPRGSDDSPPPSPPSPLTVSIPLAVLKSSSHLTASNHSNVSTSSSSTTPRALSLSSTKKRRGRPPIKSKGRPTALSSFVMKKRASSPSNLSDSGSPCLSPSPPLPPPAKRPRMDSTESESSSGTSKSSGEASMNLKKTPSIRGQGLNHEHLPKTHSRLSEPIYPNDVISSSARSFPQVATSQKCNTIISQNHVQQIHQNTPKMCRNQLDSDNNSVGVENRGNSLSGSLAAVGVTEGGERVREGDEEEVGRGAGGGGWEGGSVPVQDDDQISVTSLSTTSTTVTTNHTSSSISLSTTNNGGSGGSNNNIAKGKTSTPSVATNSNGPPRRGRPPRNVNQNGFGSLNSELQSLSSKSTMTFDKLFSYYPPKLVMKNGELVPERTLSVKQIDRMTVGSLPEDHPFLLWNLGQPVKANGETLRGKKRKPPKAVHVT